MKSIAMIALSAALATSAFGEVPGRSHVRGVYIEARNADNFVGECFRNAEINLTGNLGVMSWRIDSGSFDGVKLDGLSVVGVVRATNTLGDIHNSSYPVKSILIVDEKATAEQRLALAKFAQKMGGDLLHDVVSTHAMPISLTFADGNVHSAVAVLKAGNMAEISTRAIVEKDLTCSHEALVYRPFSNLDHAMPAYAVSHSFSGKDLDTTWSSPDKRSAVVGTFQLND